MARRYFKLVALHDHDWLVQEFRGGRLRFGWSWPGSDLRSLREKSVLTENERITWRYTQFLTERLEAGDRLVCQFAQPMREFWLAEVVTKGYDFDANRREDFNHIVNIHPLTDIGISLNAQYIPGFLKHDLTKRGHYYQIYPEESIVCLEQLVEERPWESTLPNQRRREADEFDESRAKLIQDTIGAIRKRWKGKAFEILCEYLCQNTHNIEVRSRKDNRLGWDLMIRIVDPITGGILLDEVPVQCKNYEGIVEDKRPVEDLERCIQNSKSDTAYLFILGTLTPKFRRYLDQVQETLSKKLGRQITFRVIEEETIAELYLARIIGKGSPSVATENLF